MESRGSISRKGGGERSDKTGHGNRTVKRTKREKNEKTTSGGTRKDVI